MKRIRGLCLVAALGAMTILGGNVLSEVPANAATTIEVSSRGKSLKDALASAKSGDTINITGTVKSGTVKVPAGVKITGKKDILFNLNTICASRYLMSTRCNRSANSSTVSCTTKRKRVLE